MSKPKKTENACEGCSNCCRYYFQVYSKHMKDPIMREYVEARSVDKFTVNNGDYVVYKFDQPCQYINDDGYCDIYDERPEHCARWPLQNQPAWRPMCKLMQERFPEDKKKRLRVLKINETSFY